MNKDKASLILNGKMMIELIVENLIDSNIANITISVRNYEQSKWIKQLFGKKMKTIVDNENNFGIWDVLKNALPEKGIVQILPVDSPWFDSDVIQLLTNKFQKNQNFIGVVPWSVDGPEPLLMQVKCSELRRLLVENKPVPLRTLVTSKHFKKLEWSEIENSVGHSNALKNLNYPEDLIF